MINTLNRQIIGTGGGGASASIYVTGLQESDSVTMTTPSGGSVVGVWDELPNPIAHGLPEGYTELEYIGSTGARYINTGIQAKEWARFVTDFNITTYSDNFGLFSLASGTDFKGIEFGSASEKDAFIRYHSAIVCRSSVKFTTNQWHHIDVTARVGTQSIKLDGSVVASSSASTTDDGTGIMYLFGRNYNNELNAPFKGRMATVSIYDYSDSLIHYYIPCRRNSDNKVSMYDLVSGTFLEPNGTFTGGEVIPATIPCFRLLANEYGLHTITATNGTKTSTEDVLVDALMDYWVQMDLSKLYLYKYGDECTDITGGWSKDDYYFASGQGTVYEADKGIDNMLVPNKAWSSIGLIGTNNAVNMSGYSKLKVIFTQSATGCSFNVSSAKNAISTTRLKYADLTVGTNTTNELDVSAIDTGSYVSFVRGSNSSTTAIYAVWLE